MLCDAFDALKEGNPFTAKDILEETLSADLENKEVIFTLKCANFWCDSFRRVEQMQNPYQKADTLLQNWKHFEEFISSIDGTQYEQGLFAVKRGVFSFAMKNYQSVLRENISAHKSEILCKTGLCYKVLGNYEEAIQLLSEANGLVQNSAEILAELADCYALCGEEKTAKVLFREAYFIDAQQVDTTFLESELICRLIKQVEQLGYKKQVLQEWIPVYGVLYGVFNIKRELRALEVGKLKQSIFALENELKEAGSDPLILIPRLINRYFWLIDHYKATNGERARINETILKIKLLDSNIHEKYKL